jgi:uncharacterized protein (TIGR02186 family)
VRRKDQVRGLGQSGSRPSKRTDVLLGGDNATIADITDPNGYKQLSLGASTSTCSQSMQATARRRSRNSPRRCATAKGDRPLQRSRRRQFVTNYSAPRRLAPNVPVGTHKARAFLFKSGLFIKESSAQLEIRKSGFEQSVFRVAHDYSFLYGVFAVSLAMLTGWLGRLVFRRD